MAGILPPPLLSSLMNILLSSLQMFLLHSFLNFLSLSFAMNYHVPCLPICSLLSYGALRHHIMYVYWFGDVFNKGGYSVYVCVSLWPVFTDWSFALYAGTYDIPLSQCSLPCDVGYIKRVQQGDTCCWVCTPCDPSSYVEDEYTCRACPGGWWPTKDRRGCLRLTQQYMRWDSPFAIVPAVLAVVGIAATCVVVVAFFRNFDTPVVKASGRELSFMLFAGFIICYLQTFVILAKPGPISCGLQRFGVGVGFAVTYAALLTKTNRISRIFDGARHSAKRPPFVSPRSQVIIVTCHKARFPSKRNRLRCVRYVWSSQ